MRAWLKAHARLLVGEDRLQADDVLCQRLNIGLRGVDDGKPLLQAAQVLMRRARLLADRRRYPLRHAVEPLVDGIVESRLPRAEHLGHGGKPAPASPLAHGGSAAMLCSASSARSISSLPPPPSVVDDKDDDGNQKQDDKAGQNRDDGNLLAEENKGHDVGYS